MSLSMIPEEKQAVVSKALQSAFNTNTFEDIQPLTKGLSGALVFKISVRGASYLLRIITSTVTRDKPEYYFDCLQATARADISPLIHYLNVEEKILITDFINDRYFPISEARKSMADALRKLHALPKFSNTLNYIDASDTFLQKFLASGIVSKNDISDLLELYEPIAKTYPRNDVDNLVSCHNDVKRDNIVFDGVRPWLVDWEAARVNDRYVDLVSIANFVVKNQQDEIDFLKRYFGDEFDAYQQARFFLMKQIVHMFCFTLCSIFGAAGKSIDLNRTTLSFSEFHDGLWNSKISLASNDEKVHYALVHMKELQNNLHSDRYRESLRIVSSSSRLQ